MRTNLRVSVGVATALLFGMVLGHELPDLRGQQTVVEIPNALPQGVVAGGPAACRYQAVDTQRGLVVLDASSGQCWFMSGANWAALPAIPQTR
jgi:hypothetical protein